MRTVPRSRPRMDEAIWESRSCPVSTLRTAGISRLPSSVSFTPARERVSTAKPSSCSSEFMAWLTADWVQPSSAAARVRLPSSTTAARVSYFVMFISCHRHI